MKAPQAFKTPALLSLALLPVAITLLTVAEVNPENQPPADSELTSAYRVEVLAKNLHVPWALTFLPATATIQTRRALFTERTGQIRVLQNDELLPEPALSIDVAQGNKMGMLGIVADPHFAANHFVYVAYDYKLEPFDPAKPQFRLRVARYRESNDKLVEPKTLIDNIPAWSNHTGCRLRFAADGTLFLSTGDANEPPLAQQLNAYNGKILHLNTDGSAAANNPFLHQPNAKPEIWSYGHRNPQGFDFQPGSGNTLEGRILETEHGPLGGDEINWIQPGHNYGWPVIDHRKTQDGMEPPFLEFSPSIGPGSASFYRGQAFSELKGNFLVACLRGEGLLRVELDGMKATRVSWLFHHTFGRIREMAESPEGYLYLSTSQQDPDEGHPRPGDDDDLLLRIVPASLPPSGHKTYAPSAATLEALRASQTTYPAGSTEALVAQSCAACHGMHLKNQMPLSVAQDHWKYATDDASLKKIIKEGMPARGMPSSPKLTDAEVDKLAAYLKASLGKDR